MNPPATASQDLDTGRISPLEKIGYGLGDTASNFVWGTAMSFLTYFYTDIYGLSGAAVAVLFLFTRVFDGFSDFAMGIVVDRTRTRWGKFRPYLLWMCVPLALAFVLAFSTPVWSPQAKLIYAWVTYNLVMIFYTAINIPYSALSGVMTGETVQRASLNSYRMTLAQVGGLIVNAATLPLVAMLGAGNDQKGYQLTAMLFGVIIVVLFLVCFLTTRERISPPPEQSAAIREDVRMLMKNWPWIVLSIVAILNMIFLIIRGSVTIHYYKYVLLLSGASTHFTLDWMGGIQIHKISTLLAMGSVLFIVGAIITPALVSRTGKKLLFIGTFLVSAISAAPVYWLGPGDLPALVLLVGVGSIAGGVNATLFWTMIADTADFAQWKLGRRATGVIFSSTTCAQKLGMGLGGAAVGILLAKTGYVANVEQSDSAIHGLKLLMSWIPAAGFVVCGLIFIAYPLTSAVEGRMKAESDGSN